MVVYSVGTAAIKLRQKTSKSGLYCIKGPLSLLPSSFE